MSGFYVCKTCRKRVKPKDGSLSCCGISESAESPLPITGEQVDAIFGVTPVDKWEFLTDDCDHEGIPNS